MKKFDIAKFINSSKYNPVYTTEKGALFAADSLDILPSIKTGSVDTVFADPPFNIGKQYRQNTNDKMARDDYLEWCKKWIAECCRILKPGGAFFLYNLPKWNILLGNYLYENKMEFRHWIAIEMSASLPIQNKLHPSHYSLLYFSKGKPKTFRKIRTPFLLCRHCGLEIKDYGGHRKAMNPNGVNLKDVWSDIPPVRHSKFKSKNRKANALSTKLLERVIEISTLPGDTVFDPFGGSGTTYVCAELKDRFWLGVEIDYTDDIIHRFETKEVSHHKNTDHVEN